METDIYNEMTEEELEACYDKPIRLMLPGDVYIELPFNADVVADLEILIAKHRED